ncbi:hypothetical protein D3C71_1899510 [compost metagenome]
MASLPLVKTSATVTALPLAAVAVASMVVPDTVDDPAEIAVTSTARPLIVRLTASPALALVQVFVTFTAKVFRVLV